MFVLWLMNDAYGDSVYHQLAHTAVSNELSFGLLHYTPSAVWAFE